MRRERNHYIQPAERRAILKREIKRSLSGVGMCSVLWDGRRVHVEMACDRKDGNSLVSKVDVPISWALLYAVPDAELDDTIDKMVVKIVETVLADIRRLCVDEVLSRTFWNY